MFRKSDRAGQSVEDVVRSITSDKAYELQKAAEKVFADLELSVGDRIEFETEGVICTGTIDEIKAFIPEGTFSRGRI